MSRGILIFTGLAFIVFILGLIMQVITPDPHGPAPLGLPQDDGRPSPSVDAVSELSNVREPVLPIGEKAGLEPGRNAVAFRVLVEEVGGKGIAGARVAICDPHQPDWLEMYPPGFDQGAETDEEGIVEFSQAPRDGLKIVAVAPGYLPAYADVDTALVEQVIRLAGDIAVSGTVLVDGHPPQDPVSMKLTGYKNPMAHEAPSIRRFLSSAGFRDEGMEQMTDEGGLFSFRGPAAGSKVTLEFPSWFRLRGDPEAPPRIDLITPQTGLVVDLESIPSILGRPVEDPAEERLSGDTPTLNVKFAFYGGRDQTHLRSGSIHCRVGQVFRIPYTERDVARADVSLWNPDRSLFARREVTGDFTRGRDLGDISRETLVAVRLCVFDSTGAPIAGARGEVSGHVSEKTGVHGMTRFPVPGSAKVMRVGAPGYEIKTLALNLHNGTDVTTTLHSANTLFIEVRHEDGSIPSGLGVNMTFDRPLLDEAVEHFPEFADVKGTRNGGASWGGSQHTLFYSVDADGKLIVSSITPHETFSLELKDRYEHTLRSESLRLGTEEKRNISWILPTRGRSIRGLVIDDCNQPLSGARVHVGWGWWHTTETGNDGCFSIEDIYTIHPRVHVSLDGYANFEDLDIDLTGGDLVRTYRLDRARTLWIEVLDDEGKRRDVQGLSVSCEGYPVCGGVHRGKGLYQVDNVAMRPAQIVLNTPQGELRFHITAEVTEPSIVVE